MQHTLQLAAWIELALCWLIWLGAMLRPRQKGPETVRAVSAPVSWIGVAFNLAGLACLGVWIRPHGYESPLPALLVAMVLAPPSVLLGVAASRHLGKHWRFAAVLNEDHRLIKTGPYATMRHPIYASLLGMMLATGCGYTWWPLFIPGALLILVGIEISVRAEEKLMEHFFQDEFIEYRARSRSYLPF
jgi:protein-S-isoprenylcysteine O-methyltransferase Ste14